MYGLLRNFGEKKKLYGKFLEKKIVYDVAAKYRTNHSKVIIYVWTTEKYLEKKLFIHG